METYKKQSGVLKWSLIIALVIILNLFFNYALSLVYPSPEYNAYCPDSTIQVPPSTKAQCVAVGGQWTENTYPQPQSNLTKSDVTGYCNPTFTCQKKFDEVTNIYNRNVFIILIVLGFVALGTGLFLNISTAVSSGLSLGGVLSFIIASARYWSEAGNILRVVILALALVALIWLGAKKFKD